MDRYHGEVFELLSAITTSDSPREGRFREHRQSKLCESIGGNVDDLCSHEFLKFKVFRAR